MPAFCTRKELTSKDSLEMTDDDRQRIVEAVRRASEGANSPPAATGDKACRGIVVLHGTDTVARTGERLFAEIPTRAMRPSR
jgi:L-asparaginase/Glu-tRNA(Gln) amidotransferase subunit D